MAKRKSDEFYSSIEIHLVRILLIVLLVFAGYKLIMIEAPHGQSSMPPVLPCISEKQRPPTKKKKKRKQHQISTLPACKHVGKRRY